MVDVKNGVPQVGESLAGKVDYEVISCGGLHRIVKGSKCYGIKVSDKRSRKSMGKSIKVTFD